MDTHALTKYIEEDNRLCLIVYKKLLETYRESLKKFPKDVNLIGIFFLEILKLVTGTILRKRELDHDLVQDAAMLDQEVYTWPYTGYRDLVSGLDPDKKIYGRPDSMPRRNLMRSVTEWASILRGALKSRKNTTVGIVGTGFNKQIVKECLKYGWRVKLLDDRIATGAVPDMEAQLRGITQFFTDLAGHIRLPFEVSLYERLISRHIKSLVKEGIPVPIKIDVLITGSGAEFYNRLILAQVQYYKIPVIRIHHGEGFGIADEPIFGIGDQAYADVSVGYGSFFNAHKDEYDYLVDPLWTARYIPSSSEVVARHYVKGPIQPLRFSSDTRVYYFPTSLSGYMHRYGPYRDLPDKLHLEWHNQIKEWFGPLTIKAHPKEKYSQLFRTYHQSFVTTDLREIINDVEVFIFDYISSAFFIAAATDKPIIFLDLGLRNIAKSALPYVKERTHYIDMREHGTLSKDEVVGMPLDGRVRQNQLSEVFSLEPIRHPRIVAVMKQIQTCRQDVIKDDLI